MKRRACILIVVGIGWLTVPLPAQRPSGAPMTNSVSIAGGNVHVGRGPGHAGGIRHGHHHRQGSGFYPLWYSDRYGDGFEFDEPEQAATTSVPQVIVVPTETHAVPIREASPASPIVIEIPATAERPAVKSQTPTVFVLSGGRRLEALQYMLTGESLFVTIDRQHRRIPLSAVDIDATVAANRQRGVEVQFPDDRSHIVLQF